MPTGKSIDVTSIWEVYGSNTSQGTDHPAMFCCSFTQFLKVNAGIIA
jgi:hypothetical protein